MNAEQINERLFKAKQQKITIYPCHHIRASNLGHPCERYLYLLITHWEEQKPIDVGLQNIFDLGNTLEEHTIKNIKEAGFEVFTPVNRAWKIDKPLITGREDIRIKDENGELLPVEIKGLSPFEWNKLNSIDDFLKSKKAYVKGYPAQLQVYMYYFAKEKGFFALTNKLTGETKFIEMPFNWDYADALLKKAERIYKCIKEETLPDACDDISFCENCSLSHICGTRRIPADIMIDEELDALIKKKQELAPLKSEYEKIDKEIKAKVGEREKVITGEYLIQRKSFTKNAYTVPASTQYRIYIKKL